MTQIELALFSGAMATLFVMMVLLIKVATEGFPPVERRARRFATAAAISAALAVIGSEAILYFFVSEVAGAFMAYPSLALTALAVWHASRITYRELGGGRECKNRTLGCA
jgi:cytochrome bd-type quinol oxidase subunit 2